MSRISYFLMLNLMVYFISCSETGTPEEYMYTVSISEEEYVENVNKIKLHIRGMISDHLGPFYPNSYDNETKIYVDTIVYGPDDNNRAVALVLLENSNKKIMVTENPDSVHYDGRAFLLEISENDWLVKWFNLMNINRFSNQREASEYFRYKYFVHLASHSTFDYNINDKRFWQDDLWDIYVSGNGFESYESE